MIDLRPHHGMCIGQFKGYGYSEDFVRNMTAVVNMLFENPETLVRLVVTGDCICSSCPHLKKEGCTSVQKVMEYDRKVLMLCGLHENEVVTWRGFVRLVKEYILDKNKLPEVCTNCNWLSVCLDCQGFRYKKV